MHPTLFSFPPPSQASLIHFFQNRPRSNIMIKLPHLHEASKNWLQASHTFKTTLPSRIKYVIYFSLLQEKANRKGKEGENNPKKPIKHYVQQVFRELTDSDTSTHLLPLPTQPSKLPTLHKFPPRPYSLSKMLICSLELQISCLG